MRALIFAHYDRHSVVDDYVLHLLRCYRPYFDVIIFVSATDLSDSEISSVKHYANVVIARDNVGYDFVSWRIGFEVLNQQSFEEIVFANDSCYGFLSDPSIYFNKAMQSTADFWGVCQNSQFAPHIQSFYMSFRKRLITSGFARSFWGSVENLEDKMKLILKYEVGLTQLIRDANFSIGCLVDFDSPTAEVRRRVIEDNKPFDDGDDYDDTIALINSENQPNPMQLYWAESLRCGCPFIKIELLRTNPLSVNNLKIIDHIRKGRWYDPNLILKHLERVNPASMPMLNRNI